MLGCVVASGLMKRALSLNTVLTLVVLFPPAVAAPVTLAAQSALDWSRADQEAFAALPPVSVATDSTWPPMEYINRERELVGFDIDLMREVGLRAGFRPVFETVAWDGIFAGLAAGRYEMIASSVTLLPERRRMMLFSEPYFMAAQYLVMRREDAAGVRDISDLSGGSVGAQIATTGSRLIAETEGVGLRSYDDLGLAVEDLANGRLDGIVADVAIVEYFVLSNDRYGRRLQVVGEPYAIEPYAFAIRRDRPDLRDRVNRGLAELRSDGTLDRIRAFWFDSIEE